VIKLIACQLQWSKAWTIFPSITEIMGLNPTWGIHFCVIVLCLCFLCVVRSLDSNQAPPKEPHQLCIGSRNWKVAKNKHWAVEPLIILIIIYL
jgi:hypothetical protein